MNVQDRSASMRRHERVRDFCVGVIFAVAFLFFCALLGSGS